MIDHSFLSAPSGREYVYPEFSFLPLPSVAWLESKTSFSVRSTPQIHLWEVAGRDFRCLSLALACAATHCDCLVTDCFEDPFVRWVAGADADADSDGRVSSFLSRARS